MALPLPDRSPAVYLAVFVVAAVAHMAWRYRTARGVAEQWLTHHHYRVRSLRLPLLALPRFAPKLFRNEDRSWQFRAEVDDMRLGGTGVVWLRVWTDWMGLVDREVEANWERMPVSLDDGSRTLDDKLHDSQLALLARVGDGESTFRSRARSIDDGGDFDEVVEHIMALQRRGLVTCDPPMLSQRGSSQYEVVSNVHLTPLGTRMLAERPGA